MAVNKNNKFLRMPSVKSMDSLGDSIVSGSFELFQNVTMTEDEIFEDFTYRFNSSSSSCEDDIFVNDGYQEILNFLADGF